MCRLNVNTYLGWTQILFNIIISFYKKFANVKSFDGSKSSCEGIENLKICHNDPQISIVPIAGYESIVYKVIRKKNECNE